RLRRTCEGVTAGTVISDGLYENGGYPCMVAPADSTHGEIHAQSREAAVVGGTVPLPICNPLLSNGRSGGLDQSSSRKEIAMKHVVIKHIALFAALVISSAANAGAYDYTSHYSYVGKPPLANAQLDDQT